MQAAEFLPDNSMPRVVVLHHSQGQAVATGLGALRQSSSASSSGQSEDRGCDEASLNAGKPGHVMPISPRCAMLRQSVRNQALRRMQRRVRILQRWQGLVRLPSLALLRIGPLASAGQRSKVCDKEARCFNPRLSCYLRPCPTEAHVTGKRCYDLNRLLTRRSGLLMSAILPRC
jgi:hypothetical protein